MTRKYFIKNPSGYFHRIDTESIPGQQVYLFSPFFESYTRLFDTFDEAFWYATENDICNFETWERITTDDGTVKNYNCSNKIKE